MVRFRSKLGLYCGEVVEISQPLLPIGMNTPSCIGTVSVCLWVAWPSADAAVQHDGTAGLRATGTCGEPRFRRSPGCLPDLAHVAGPTWQSPCCGALAAPAGRSAKPRAPCPNLPA